MSKATYMTQKDALELVIDSAESKITRTIIVNTEIGSYKPGDKIDMGENLTDVIEKLVTVYQTPGLTVTLNPSTTLYEKGVDSVTGLKVLAQVTKKTNPISSIQWYINNSLVDELTSADGISNGGNYTYTHNATISNDVTIKVVVTDSENKTVTKEIPIKFVFPTYVGVVDNGNVDSANIVANCTKLIREKAVYTQKFTANFQTVVFASIWELTSIINQNNYEVISNFTKSSISVNGTTYYVYSLPNVNITDFSYKFTY